MAEYLKTLYRKDTPVRPGTIRKYVPADFTEFLAVTRKCCMSLQD